MSIYKRQIARASNTFANGIKRLLEVNGGSPVRVVAKKFNNTKEAFESKRLKIKLKTK